MTTSSYEFTNKRIGSGIVAPGCTNLGSQGPRTAQLSSNETTILANSTTNQTLNGANSMDGRDRNYIPH